MKKFTFNPKYLLSPSWIFAGIILGIAIGFANKTLANNLASLGNIYLNLIQMSVLPIMVTAVISSFGNLFHSNSASGYIKKLFFTFITGLVVASIFGLAIGVLFAPGSHISESEKLLLSQNITQITNTTSDISSEFSVLQFITNIIPTNIFSALTDGNMLAILFFCILLGIALGRVRSASTKACVLVLDGLFTALLEIVSWIMYGLPFGLCFLFAGYTAQLGFMELIILSRLILVFYVSLFIMFVAYSFIVWRYLGGSYWGSIKVLKEPLLIAFGTSSSLSAIPFMLENLQHKCKLDKNVVDFSVPLGISLNKHGSVIRLVISALFTAQLFNQPLTFPHTMIILAVSILASIASSGVPGIASIGVLALVLQPLGLPTAVGVALLAAIVPLTDPIITLANVYGNCVSVIVVAKHKKHQGQRFPI